MFRGKAFLAIVLVLGIFISAVASAAPRFDREVRSALRFLAHYQTDGSEGYDPGQWRARVTSYVPSLVGVGKFAVPFDEPTAFAASTVANVLAEIYSYNPSYTEIPAMLRQTYEGLSSYRWGKLFNFYPPKNFRGLKVRGPRFMYLARQWQGFANIPPDADTTSVSYTFLHYLESLERGVSPRSFQSDLPEDVINAFSSYRDLNRKAHFYNAAQGQIRTGAFLTWLFNEKDPRMPHNYFAAPDKGTRIPFNVNDVDCTVNANVLKVLTYAGRTSGPGYRATCDYLNHVVRLKQFYFCGMYYPSFYSLPYSIATTLHAGASCLTPSKNQIVDYLLRKQHRNGSWRNSILARPDYVQSTAWALNSLLILGNPQDRQHRDAVERGLRFLLSQAETDSAGRMYWSGQVFFAAIFVARFPVVWRSTAYTTALVAKALTLAGAAWY